MHTMTLDMPEEVFSVLRRSPDEFLREMRLAAAMHWYAKGLVSQEKAAEVAGLDRTDFLLALAREQIEAFPVDLAQLTEPGCCPLPFWSADGRTVLLSSHNMLEVEFLSDRVALIRAGEIIETGTPEELKVRHGGRNLEEVFLKAGAR